ncbi:hypothetical protein DXG01_015212 [Tephrocybe rancida]|nr:hypothetical protein DXG01_015212 [Tephrocybe rancida]
MASLTRREVVIDDSNTQAITYNGDWFSELSDKANIGIFGPTYNSTSHGTKGNNSLSDDYQVYGTTIVTKVDGTRQDPNWQCFIDTRSLEISPGPVEPENNEVLCQDAMLEDGPHNLFLNVITEGTIFWFDWLTYTPSLTTGNHANNAVFIVENNDTAITYSDGWSAFGDIANSTQSKGAQVTINFQGTGVTWLGILSNPGSLWNPALVSFSIDNGTAENVWINGPTSGNISYRQAGYRASGLAPTSHSLLVTYEGDSTTIPLILDYLFVSNGSLPATTSTDPTTVTSTPGRSSSALGSSSSHTSGTAVGLIVGGLIGGLAIVVLLLIVWWYRRHRATRISSAGTSMRSIFSSTAPESHTGTNAPSMEQSIPGFEPFTLARPSGGAGSPWLYLASKASM